MQRETFRGVPSAKEVDRLVGAIKSSGADVAVAIGGGSTIDAVKAAGFLADIRWANCPTVASTDAPCSALSVIYTEDGEFEEYRFFPRNPDLVLVDSQVVANAPVDLLVAGVGDALATWLEAPATAQSNSNTMAGGLPSRGRRWRSSAGTCCGTTRCRPSTRCATTRSRPRSTR